MSIYFVAGIGTDVGKTFATCALLHASIAKGRPARGFKPIITGWDTGSHTDTAQIIKAGGIHQTVEEVSPWRYTAPLSPHRAAELGHKPIDIEQLINWTQGIVTANMGDDKALTLIETAGGVMVPLTEEATTLDWMAAMNLPVILVTGSYLGSISHTLTSLAALRAKGLTVAALILSETDGSTVTLEEAQLGLAPFITDIPLRIAQPLVSSWEQATAIQAMEI